MLTRSTRGLVGTVAFIPDNPLDDVNPPFNGSVGRAPVSPNPVPAGYPTPFTTGLRGVGVDVGSLTPHAGGVTFSTPGQVIEGFDFAESVQLNAANITLRRCRITSSNFFPLEISAAGSGVIIEDCRIRGDGVNPAAAILTEGAGTIIRRCDISGGADSVKFGANNITLQDCYMQAGYVSVPLDTHNDCVQAGGGTNFTITGCSIIGRWREQTSCCIFKADFGNISGITLTGNYFSGGNNCLMFVDVGANTVSGLVMTDNRFELNSWNIGLFPGADAYKSTGDMAASFTETGTQVVASP